MRYFSLFSGIGGFELGLIQAYVEIINRKTVQGVKENQKGNETKGQRLESKVWKGINDSKRQHIELPDWSHDPRAPHCVGYSEIDKHAIGIYEKYFKHKNYGDIRKIKPRKLPDFDLLIGGFPCQSFSIAGKRKGFEDTRGTLFFEIARIARAKRPRLLLLENVKGLLNHEGGRTFGIILRTLDGLGYDLQWQVLNSKDFGVPQNRERVFVIGHLRGTPRPEVFPVKADSQADIVIPTLTARYTASSNGGYVRHGQTHQMNEPVHSNDRIYATDGVSPTLNTAQGGNRQPKIIAHYGHTKKSAKEMRISPTLKAQSHGHEPMTLTGTKIRRLTPKECERLQGFPDGWTEGASDTQRYKCLGNAVTVNVVKAIARKLVNIRVKSK